MKKILFFYFPRREIRVKFNQILINKNKMKKKILMKFAKLIFYFNMILKTKMIFFNFKQQNIQDLLIY